MSRITKISFPNKEYADITTGIFDGTLKLSETLTDSSQLTFGQCSADKFQVTLAGTADYNGLIIKVTVNEDGLEKPLFVGKVDECKLDVTKTKREIVAYDLMYYLRDTECIHWYEQQTFPLSLKKFRDSLFKFVGLEQVETSLINDELVVQRTISASSLPFGDLISAICEINVVNGHINRSGVFEYVSYGTSISNATTLPETDIKKFDSSTELYSVKPIDKVQFNGEDDDIGAVVGNGNNAYIMTGNMLLYGMTTAEMEVYANNFLQKVKSITYTPSNIIKIVSNLDDKLGSLIRLTDGSQNKASGTLINAQDTISGKGELRDLVHNLLPNSYIGVTKTNVGVTIQGNDDGSIKLVGTSNGYARNFIVELGMLRAGTYTFSSDVKGNSFGKVEMSIRPTSNYNVELAIVRNTSKTDVFTTKIFTLEQDTEISLVFYHGIINQIYDMAVYPMLELGTTPHPYVPYAGYEVKSVGKNLFDKDNLEDGIVVSGGKADTSNSLYKHCTIAVKSNTQYSFTKAKEADVYSLSFWDENDKFISLFSDKFHTKTFTTPSNCNYVKINAVMIATHALYPDSLQLEYGTQSTEYEPYTSDTVTITNDMQSAEIATYDGVTNIISPTDVNLTYRNTTDKYFYIMSQEYSGAQLYAQTITCTGDEERDETVNDTRSKLVQLAGKTNVLTRDVEETNSRISDVQKGLSTEIKQTANGLQLQIDYLGKLVDTNYMVYETTEIPTLNNYPATTWHIPIYPSKTLYPSTNLKWRHDKMEYDKYLGALVMVLPQRDVYVFKHTDQKGYYFEIDNSKQSAYILRKTYELQATMYGLTSSVNDVRYALRDDYFTQEELSSIISQTSSEIRSEVSSTYQLKGDYAEVATVKSMIEQTANSISLSVTNGEKSAGITIKMKDTDGKETETSGTIEMRGVVTFTDLSTEGSTVISGDNITTGTIHGARLFINGESTVQIDAQESDNKNYMWFTDTVGSERFQSVVEANLHAIYSTRGYSTAMYDTGLVLSGTSGEIDTYLNLSYNESESRSSISTNGHNLNIVAPNVYMGNVYGNVYNFNSGGKLYMSDGNTINSNKSLQVTGSIGSTVSISSNTVTAYKNATLGSNTTNSSTFVADTNTYLQGVHNYIIINKQYVDLNTLIPQIRAKLGI